MPQSNFPDSTTIPPSVVPWPPRNFVAECSTMSAPCSIGSTEVRRRQRRVDHQRDVVGVRQVRQRGEVRDAATRVADHLGVEQPGPVGDRRRVVVDAAADERRLHAESPERAGELGDRAAVETARRHDVVAGLGERAEGEELRGLPAAGGDTADRTLEAGDPLLERRHGRVPDPAVDVAVLLQREQVRRVGRVLEDEARGLVDRHGTRTGRRVGRSARVQCAGPETPGAFTHRSSP